MSRDGVAVWKQLHQAGLADAVTDAIIRTQPIPEKLLRDLATTRTPDTPPGRDLKTLRNQRQLAVLTQAAQGRTAQQTAHHLGISVETVKTHRKNALRRLNAHTMTAAVATAVRKGLIP